MQLPISESTFGKSFLAGKGKLKLETADDAWGTLVDSEGPFGSKTTDVALVSISAGEDAEDLKLGQPKGLQMTVSASGSVAGSVRLIRKADDPLLTSPELKELLRQGKLYVALELNGSAAGSAKGSYVAGPLTPTFGLNAGGTVGYTQPPKLHDASTSARDIVRDLFKGVRLPASLEKASDVPDTGELLLFRRLSIDFPKLRPVKEYIKLQGRFRHLTDEMIEEIEKRIHKEYEELREKGMKGAKHDAVRD